MRKEPNISIIIFCLKNSSDSVLIFMEIIERKDFLPDSSGHMV